MNGIMYLDSVLFTYRTSKQASTRFSPFFLLYGRDHRGSDPFNQLQGLNCHLIYVFTVQAENESGDVVDPTHEELSTYAEKLDLR